MSDMEKHPKALEMLDSVMSNFDGVIDNEIAAQLEGGEYCAPYPACNFYGIVWKSGDKFACQIDQYGFHVETMRAGTLAELRDAVSDEYGYE